MYHNFLHKYLHKKAVFVRKYFYIPYYLHFTNMVYRIDFIWFAKALKTRSIESSNQDNQLVFTWSFVYYFYTVTNPSIFDQYNNSHYTLQILIIVGLKINIYDMNVCTKLILNLQFFRKTEYSDHTFSATFDVYQW